jgi:hypothetical protein
MNSVINDVVDLSIKNIIITDKIYTTPFTKDGIYDSTGYLGDCHFPFYGKNKKYIYQCTPKTQGLMCPTKLDYQRRPDKWGYCPEKIEATKERMNVIDVDAVGDENESYKPGKCDFPYFSKLKIITNNVNTPNKQYKLKYDCTDGVQDGIKFEWCPIKTVSDKSKKTKKNSGYTNPNITNELLSAATDMSNVRYGKWNDGKLSITALSGKKSDRGYCQPPIKSKIDEEEIDESLPDLTLENYSPNYCNKNFTPSKGGYDKHQLYKFGIKYLKIPSTQMLKDPVNGIKLQKDQLCNIINNKFREIKKRVSEVTDDMRLKVSTKDISLCDTGESKGGYSKNELREIAINYFNLDENLALLMDKTKLCQYISSILKLIKNKKEGIIDNGDTTIGIDLSAVKKIHDKFSFSYPGDISLCKETPNRGGKNIKSIKQIAIDNFGIDTTNLNKNQICNAIESKLKNIKKEQKEHKNKDKDDSILDIDLLSDDEIEELTE